MNPRQEPLIRVGLITGAREVRFTLTGRFTTASGEALGEGAYTASAEGGVVRLAGDEVLTMPAIVLEPADFDSCRFTVHGVTIGIGFHWERAESQQFQGSLKLEANAAALTLINELPLEAYLVSVISSEMSASCPAEFLRVHAVVSRSWLLAQLEKRGTARTQQAASPQPGLAEEELIRWYDRESHNDFDVCADDHCQRYQGISKAFSGGAFDAVHDTRGKVLTYGGDICDARYSKCCGGMSENYSAVWEDQDVPYLKQIYDGPGSEPPGYRLPLSVDANAEDWIASSPLAYCGMPTSDLLARVLPGFDQETRDFYRWRVDYSQEELSQMLGARLGLELGRVHSLMPLERGESGRIVKLRITAEKRTLIIGKELEIRRALSRSHLYSSAFVVQPTPDSSGSFPPRFTLIGAGWGHGVGLCQIGAAVMADLGHAYEDILAHYFRDTAIKGLY